MNVDKKEKIIQKLNSTQGGTVEGVAWKCSCGEGGIGWCEANANFALYHHRINHHTARNRKK